MAQDLLTPCPHCQRQPVVDRCGPWPKDLGPAPWYVGCYQPGGREHCVAVNGDTKDDAMKQWQDTAAAMQAFND